MSKLREMREKILSKKDNKGFTLVELIVVIVILAILVGVTIGGVYGYVNKSRVNTDINNASAITSTLSTMTTVKDLSGNSDKFQNKKVVISWSTAQNVAEAGITAKEGTANADTTTDTTLTDTTALNTVRKKIAELLPDGLPAVKTANAEYRLEMSWDAKGNFQSVKCTAFDGNTTAAKPLEAQE